MPLPLLAAALAPSVVGGVAAERLTHLADAHADVKMAVVAWQSVLLRADRLAAFLLILAAFAAVLVDLRGWRWSVGAGVGAVAAVALLDPLAQWTVPVAFAWLAVNVAPAETLRRWGRRWRPLAWIPGTELGFGSVVAVVLGAGPRTLRLAAAASAVGVGGCWIVADTISAFWEREKAVFAPWPDERVDPRVTTVARAPEGTKCEFHDIDVVGDRAIVVAETSLQLLSVPRSGSPSAWPLPPWWGRMEGLVMDSETDPATGVSWYLSGPSTVTGVAWRNGWEKVSESPTLPAYLHHTYAHWLGDRNLLVLFSIGTKNTIEPPLMVELDTPGLQSPTVRQLRLADGGTPPTFRDLVWVPSLDRFVLAPDFGDRLYLAAPGSSVVAPWMEIPALNGRMLWVAGLNRLFVAMPNRTELWVIDPQTATVERTIPTQLGVRAVAVDVQRGLFLTASVLTGRVLVQRLADGSVQDSFGTLMPMVRNLALFPDSGEALLSTWTALYRIPYVPVE